MRLQVTAKKRSDTGQSHDGNFEINKAKFYRKSANPRDSTILGHVSLECKGFGRGGSTTEFNAKLYFSSDEIAVLFEPAIEGSRLGKADKKILRILLDEFRMASRFPSRAAG